MSPPVPFLTNKCFVAQAFARSLTDDELALPPEAHEGEALWDTGATHTVISAAVVTALQLSPIGRQPVRGVYSATETDVFLVSLWLPNRSVIGEMPVLLGSLDDIDLLIGMDVIGLGDFAVATNEQRTVFTFRTPSQGPIDFTGNAPLSRQARRQAERKRRRPPR